MTMPTDTSEKGLEALIESSMLNEAKYEHGDPRDYDRKFCLDRVMLLRFLQATQPNAVERLGLDGSGQEKFFKRLLDQIQARGIVDVLRKGVRERDVSVTFYYPKPASTNNPTAAAQYASNIFSVTRQLKFSEDNTALALDLCIFINGLPLITFELKNQFTKQNVKDAIRQYQNDRNPREPLFAFTRCLVHFAVDDALVYMTTHLRGKQTEFLPFNKGEAEGAGNPVNPHGLKTDYLWKEILSKDTLSLIVEKYAQVVEDKDENGKKRKKLVFPRYHQLDVVRRVLAHARAFGVGQRYLVQHSAGSGKSNSITWLAHQLVELTDANGTNGVFDSIVVVTDRRILDKQIRDNIKQFAHVAGVVQPITEGSQQLREALDEGKKIIITTIQKFPFILKDIQALGDKRFGLIIDEAHSSQSGRAAGAMNIALGGQAEGDEEETIEDQINRLIEEQHLLKNASYFAFTATPKNKTLQLFGVRDPATGKFHPFHAYSMKQAIEEEFILDVLQNYTTYHSYYKLLKKIEDDPQFDTKRAQKKLKRYVEKHPAAIRQKTEIMVDHFMDEVMRQRKINGQAKAMVVTNSIESAIRYKLAFDEYLKKLKSPYKALVAFTGSKEIDGKRYDESSMNGFPSAEIPEQFKNPEYRFLIVAEKFQTGFDQPLLHTMYVDKVLSGVNAVQTLSRLNRAYKPYKTDTFVLDFVNSADEIKRAFEPFYKTTILSEETNINRLNDLQDKLDAYQVYARDQVEELMSLYLTGAPRDHLDPILDVCVNAYKELDTDQQIDFKAQAKTFVRTYQFLVLILPFKNPYWESLKTFLQLLIPKLPAPDDEDLARGVLESVDMDSYRVQQQATIAIKLEGGQELNPTPEQPRQGREVPELDYLSNIVQEFNERWGTNWTDDDKIRRFLFEDLPSEVSKDADYQNAKRMGDRQNAEITHAKKVEDVFQNIIVTQTELYRKFADDPEFKKWLVGTLFKMDYERTQPSPAPIQPQIRSATNASVG